MNVWRGGRPSRPWLVWCFGLMSMAWLVAGTAKAATTEAAPLRIKNGHHLRVTLGKTKQSAIGVRPEKELWRLELAADLVGAAADFEDVTPNAFGARWSVPVDSVKLVLDSTRFLPSHVYRLAIRRDRVFLGSALVYLYPPPSERVHRVQLDAEPAKAEPSDDASAPGVIPKGRL